MEKNNIEIENQKFKNALDFYMLANNLKYQPSYHQNQSIADSIYGTMVLAIAFNSEYEVTDNLGPVLRTILLKEMQINNNKQFIHCLSKLDKGYDYYMELQANRGLCESNNEVGTFIETCKLLDQCLNNFFDKYLVDNKIKTTDYKELFTLAKEKGFFVSIGNNEAKNLEIFRFYYLNDKLKMKVRSGWDSTHWNIQHSRVEKISEHIVGTLALAMGLDSEFDFGIDMDKVLSILSIHEIGEIKIGDITPFDGITPAQKQEIEHKAIIDVIGNLTKGKEMIHSFFEFDDQKNNDAKFAHYCDKLEADIQSKVYQDMGCHNLLTAQENNVVFQNSKIQKIIEEGATTAFDIWYAWDKSIYTENPTFTKALKYVKNTKLK